MDRPANSAVAEVIMPLAAMCADERVGALLTEGVHPRNKRQEATVVCHNHKSSTEYHELVSKAHNELRVFKSRKHRKCLVLASPAASSASGA